MADDIEMTPINASELTPVTAAEPPKVNPLEKPVAGASALKPGLKLPPKTNLTAKLKLPPKPGLATGLKLPPKPGATAATKPAIRKPSGALNLPKPISIPKPIAPTPAPAPAAAEAPKPLEALKAVTQNLKGVTQAIPQQAILHKTGIIADSTTSDAQKEAAKHKTARISLSDAMGVAPVKDEHAPMKTIRIKRPINIPGATSQAPTPQPNEGSPAPASAEVSASVTQRKTLKISRPSAVRPSGKFGIKKPASQATTIVHKPAETGAAPADGEVADIPDMPAVPPMPQPVRAVSDMPEWATTLSAVVQIAACVVIGMLVWYFYKDAQLPTFCGGLGWNV